MVNLTPFTVPRSDRSSSHPQVHGDNQRVRVATWENVRMDALRHQCEQTGFFTRAMARDFGYDDKTVSFMLRSGVWHRFRRGYYSCADLWAALDDVQRHRVRSRAVLHSLGDAVALSHVSGLLVRHVDTWGVDLSKVHVTRLDGGAGRVEGDVVHHVGSCSTNDVELVDGLRTLDASRCAIECASGASSEAALVVFNSLLNRGDVQPEELFRQFERMASWPGVRHLHVPIRLASPGAESVGESRGMWIFWTVGIPRPNPQFEVRDRDGSLRGTCDWGWPDEGLLGEFDGRVKYGRLLGPGQEPGDVVFAEKRREDELRELTGFAMLRLVWSDYQRPRLIKERFDRLVRRTG